MTDDSDRHAESSPPASASRRGFLKVASVVAAGAAAATVGCAPSSEKGGKGGAAPATPGRRVTGFDRATLDALGEVMLPSSLGAAGRTRAVDAFVSWVDGYEPLAEEMHGYGYAEVRYLPPDPAPGWRAQLEGLDLLARKTRRKGFAELPLAERQAVVTTALAGVHGASLPDPLGAPHVAVALVSHWTTGAEAWDLALGAKVGTGTCRSLDGVVAKPLPIVGGTA